jgi:hypothetical protein
MENDDIDTVMPQHGVLRSARRKPRALHNNNCSTARERNAAALAHVKLHEVNVHSYVMENPGTLTWPDHNMHPVSTLRQAEHAT